MNYEFTGHSVPGGIVFYGPEKARHERTLARFKGGVPVKVIYREVGRIRTINQNKLYWKRNKELSAETGYSKESLHEGFMERAGFGKRVKVRTAEYFFRQSSRDLDTKQFSQLMGYQDELAQFLNEDREPDACVRLTQGDID